MASRSDAESPRETAPKSASSSSQRQILGKYEIRKRIGSGGMGSVFLAFDPELKRTVALKVLPREKAQNPILVKRFKAEAQAAAHLRHENIVAVYDAGEADGYLYIALEYVDGTDLQNLVNRRGPLPVKRSIEIVKQVARALQHAHERNIVHRDIKPSNMLISADGTIKLTDMGLARSIDETTETDITRAGTTVGTVDYMSPEQARSSRAADIRSDIYSLGCAWYQMLTGKPPFSEGSVTNKLHAHATAPPPNPRDENPDVPEALIAVLHRMMAKSPDQRYQTPQELLKDLENAHLSREAISNAVLAALVDDEAPQKPQRASTSGPPTLPPKRARRRDEDATEKSGRNLEPLKYVAAVALVACFLGILYWMGSGFSSVLDHSSPADQENPFAAEVPGAVSEPETVRPAPAAATRSPKTGTQGTADQSETQASASPRPVNIAVTDPPPEPPRHAGGTERSRDPVGESSDDLPEWVSTLAPRESHAANAGSILPTFTVGRTDDGPPSKFATLSAALAALPETGGRIELVGDGPFVLPPTRLTQRNVTIAADEGSRPVVLLVHQAGAAMRGGAILQISGGTLALTGVHLIAVAEQLPADGALALVEVTSGDLTVTGGSVTLLGTRAGRTTAFVVSDALVPARPDPPRVLLDRTVVRGPDLTSLEIDCARVDHVSRQSLYLTGTAPVLRLTNTRPSIGAPSLSQSGPGIGRPETHATRPPERVLRFLSTTAVADRTALVLDRGYSAGEPPGTLIICTNSIFAAPADRSGGVLLSLANWPRNSAAGAGESQPRNLQWTSDGSLFPGWTELARAADVALAARSADQWERIWGQSADERQFPDQGWPARRPEEPENTDLGSLSPRTIDAGGVRATDGGLPGCDVALLTTPAPGRIERAAALARRPLALPGSLVDATDDRTVRIDLSRQDLGKTLSEMDWPSGTRFIVSGAGTYKCRPIRVEGRSFRVEFVQAEGLPLTIEPRSIDYRRGGEPFISVSGGQVELVDGRFKVPATTRRDIPESLLEVVDGGFLLERCSIQGPMIESPGFETLIRWRHDSSSAANPRIGQVTDSFLAAWGNIIEADVRGSLLIAHNSVLASIGDVLVCDLAEGSATGGLVDLRHCTLSATERFIHVRSAPTDKATEAPVSFFVDATVFAPPLDAGRAASPVLLSDASGARRRGWIDWWENGNGYSNELKAFLLDGSDAAGRNGDELQSGWIAVWGDSRILRPLAAPDGVRLQENYPQRTKVGPRDFALRTTSTAASWGITGGPIGADVESLPAVELPEQPKSAEPERRPRRPRPSSSSPDF